MRWLYLICLLVSLACMVLMDHRWRLFLFADARRGALTLLVGVLFFLLADVAAILLGFYGRGQSAALSGLEVLPHLPIEEIVFVTFLCYLTMVLCGLLRRFSLGREGRS
ncbi:lycopene cyclase domain-containing protein [Occultella kanbiaonis]|uniref:lycopene cyclase domain-containing protein n=1 Tax=Occultella kanbiaonis TaxID=2675754 RepID=UPI0012B75023|nr:lycopene cyclase domain-containing protein [Occultella kanbiaonis]